MAQNKTDKQAKCVHLTHFPLVWGVVEKGNSLVNGMILLEEFHDTKSKSALRSRN